MVDTGQTEVQHRGIVLADIKNAIGAAPAFVLHAFILFQACLWTLLPWAVNHNLDKDTIEIIFWGREWQIGYFKHPALLSWIAELLYMAFGANDTIYYIIAQSFMVASFYFVWMLAVRYVEPLQAVLAVICLPVFGYYSFTTPYVNHNTILNVVWTLMVLLAHGAIVERKDWVWPWLGLCAGIGVWCKYPILILVAVLGMLLLLDSRHWARLRRPEFAWGCGVFLAVIAPHLLWLVQNDFTTLRHAAASGGMTGVAGPASHILFPLTALAMMIGMALPVLGLLGLLGRPRWSRQPLDDSGRFLLAVTLGPIGLVLALSALFAVDMKVEWFTPFFFTVPLLILRLFFREAGPLRLKGFGLALGGLSSAMAVVYALIFLGLVPLLPEARWTQFPGRALARAAAKAWNGHCDTGVPIVVGDRGLAGLVSYRLPHQPQVYAAADRRQAPWLSDDAVRRQGAVIVWSLDAPGWFADRAELTARFGTVVEEQPPLILDYPVWTGLPPARVGIAVVLPVACSGGGRPRMPSEAE